MMLHDTEPCDPSTTRQAHVCGAICGHATEEIRREPHGIEQPTNRRHTRRIVTADEFLRSVAVSVRDAHDHLMPETAPVARALLGHVVGDGDVGGRE